MQAETIVIKMTAASAKTDSPKFRVPVRRQAGRTRAQAARDMKVSQTSIFNAEETPDQSLVKLRVRMIEAYSKFNVRGPVFMLEDK